MFKDKEGCVYMIRNKINNKVYIGQTYRFKSRKWEHLNLLRKNIHKNHYLQRDFNMYGENSLEFIKIADNLNYADRIRLETIKINEYGGIESDSVYNYQDNITENEEMRCLVSVNQKGKTIKPESIEKMRISLTGRKLTEKHKCNIRASCVKFMGENNPAKRPDVRKKISEKVSGKGNGMYGKRKYTEEFINELKQSYIELGTYKAVSLKYNIAPTTVINLVKYGETFNPNTYKHLC